MENIEIITLNEKISEDFYRLSAEYLPGSSHEKMRKYSGIFSDSFIAAMHGNELAGIAFGWLRNLEFPGDDSFVLDGIAVRQEFQGRGIGRRMLNRFEASAKEYGAETVSVGSAEGGAEKFYIACGYVPVEYKIWENGRPVLKKAFESFDDYLFFKRFEADGFIVMTKNI